MVQFADRVKTTSSSLGNGAITLSSTPVTGYQAVPSSLDGMTVGYVIESGSAWEIGTGVYTHSNLGLTRNLRSSSTGSLLSLSSGTHTVFLSPAFEDIKAPTITVTVSGGNFLIDGTANQTINLVPSVKYVFDVTAVGSSHPFRFATQADGANSSQYTTGITVYEDSSNVQKHIEVQLEQDAPSTLYYYCTAHSGMGGTVNVGGGTSYTHPNHSGEVTSSGDGATVIADNVVDEANLKVSNSPTDGYVLTARSGNTGGMTWEEASGGGGSSTSALTETTFSATANQTAFVVSGGITNASNVSVFQNGVKLEEGSSKDYTVNASTNTVTLNSGAAASDVVEVLEYGQPASSGGAGVTTYANLAAINAVSSPSEGDLAYDLSGDQLYIRTTSAWKRIALGVDETPVIITEPASTHTLNDDGSTSTVTMLASDPEGFGITYGIAYPNATNALPDQLANATTINQTTGVYTFDPSTTNGGTVKVRLSASDGARTTTRLVTLSLTLIQGWMIGSGAYDNKSFSVSSQEANPRGIDISANGTIMIMTGNTSDDIHYYTLSTAFDISTASHTGSINQTDNVPNDVRFGDSGNKVFVCGNSGSYKVESIPLSTAYDLSTAGSSTLSSSLSSLSSTANQGLQGMAFRTDGTKMYILDFYSDSVHEYSLSTAWDISTLSYTTAFSVSSQEANGQAVDFSSDGTKMFVVGQSNDTVYQYNLSTAWDVSTASYSSTSFSISSQEGAVGGMCFGDSGKTMYIVGQTNDTIYQYSTEA